MVLELYKSMLKIAETQEVPKYVEMTFHISKKESESFWEDESLSNEHRLLFDEWEMDSKKSSRYTKIFYGIKFAIEFNHNS